MFKFCLPGKNKCQTYLERDDGSIHEVIDNDLSGIFKRLFDNAISTRLNHMNLGIFDWFLSTKSAVSHGST